MRATAAKLVTWINAMFSDNGVPSSSRVLTAILIAFVMGMTLAFVAVLVQHRITMADFTGYLGTAGTFLSWNILALYGTTRVGNAMDKWSNQSTDNGSNGK